MRKNAIDLMLRAVQSQEEKAEIIKAVAPTLKAYVPGCEAFSRFDATANLERWLWSTATGLVGDPELVACGALLGSAADRIVAPYLFSAMLKKAACATSQEAKAEFLTGLTSSYIERSDVGKGHRAISRAEAWKQLWGAAVQLPEGLRDTLLGMLACESQPLAPENSVEQWRSMLGLANSMAARDRISVYRGMVAILATASRETAKDWFNQLWECCSKLPWGRQGITLENLAHVCLQNRAFGQDELIKIVETSVKYLAPVERLAPLRIIIAALPMIGSLPFSRFFPVDGLTAEERSMVINYCATSANFRGPLKPLIDDMLELPPSARHWALAGILAQPNLVSDAGGKIWIDQIILPIVEETKPVHRTTVLCNLAVLALPSQKQLKAPPTIYPLLSDQAWNTVQRYIAALPATQRSDVLLALCHRMHQSNKTKIKTAWEWTLAQTQTLPPYLRAPVLRELLVLESREGQPNATALFNILPLLWEVPRIYRAYPLQAAARLRDELDGLDFLKGYFSMFRLKVSVPCEDRG